MISKREPKHMGEVMSDIAERYNKLTKTKMSKEVDYIEIINNLNEWVNDKQGDDYIINFSYTTNGWYHCIEWDRLLLWDSETDGREWIEDTDVYEDLEEYIKKEFNNYIDTLTSLKFKPKQR